MKSYVVKKSKINGKGLFANKDLKKGELSERYLNHSCNPNVETRKDGIEYAIRDIKKGGINGRLYSSSDFNWF